jgi:hypothetical protein
MRLPRGEAKTRSSLRQVRRSQRERSSSVVCPRARGRLSYEQSRRHSLGSSRVHSECARYASFLSLRLVWKWCLGRGSVANANNASTPPLDTGNIGFGPPTGVGNSTWIVRVEFWRHAVNRAAPNTKLPGPILPVVNYTTTRKGGNSARAHDAHTYFLYHKQLGHW